MSMFRILSEEIEIRCSPEELPPEYFVYMDLACASNLQSVGKIFHTFFYVFVSYFLPSCMQVELRFKNPLTVICVKLKWLRVVVLK